MFILILRWVAWELLAGLQVQPGQIFDNQGNPKGLKTFELTRSPFPCEMVVKKAGAGAGASDGGAAAKLPRHFQH